MILQIILKDCAYILSHVQHFATLCPQVPLSVGFLRQEYWSGLLFPPPGDLPDPEIKPTSPALQVDSLSLSHWRSPKIVTSSIYFLKLNYVFVILVTQKRFIPYCWDGYEAIYIMDMKQYTL